MNHPLHITFIVLLSVAMLSGCMPTKPDSSSPSARLQYSIDHGDYKYAYVALQELRSNKDAKSQNAYKRFMDTYRAQLEQGGLDYLSNYAESTALLYGSLDEFILSAQDKLNAYNAVASVPIQAKGKEVLEEGFSESRSRYPIEYPVNDVKVGMSTDEFFELVPKTPIRTVPVRIPSTPPTDFVVNEYEFTLPEEYKLSGMQPMWVAFLDGKVVRAGLGNVKNAEYEGYQWYLNEDVAAGRIKQAQAMRILYDKFKEVYGQPNTYVHEYMTYLIMVSERIDNKEITQTEAEYLMAQKNAELQERIAEAQRQQAAAARQNQQYKLQQKQLAAQKQAQEQAAQMARSQMMMQAGFGLLQLNQMNQMNQSLRGIQQNTTPRSYTIMPMGSGYRVNPY